MFSMLLSDRREGGIVREDRRRPLADRSAFRASACASDEALRERSGAVLSAPSWEEIAPAKAKEKTVNRKL
jgi:hypothetical protein